MTLRNVLTSMTAESEIYVQVQFIMSVKNWTFGRIKFDAIAWDYFPPEMSMFHGSTYGCFDGEMEEDM